MKTSAILSTTFLTLWFLGLPLSGPESATAFPVGAEVHRVFSHECGPFEMHEMLDEGHHCLVCARSFNSTGLVVQLPCGSPLQRSGFLPIGSREFVPFSSHSPSLQRGPPPA